MVSSRSTSYFLGSKNDEQAACQTKPDILHWLDGTLRLVFMLILGLRGRLMADARVCK